MSPIQYLKVLRIEKAKHLLETSFLSVKEITHLVGLNDESHFVRDFKKAYGVSPTPYRVRFNGSHPNESENGNGPPPEERKWIADAGEEVLLQVIAICGCLLVSLEGVI